MELELNNPFGKLALQVNPLLTKLIKILDKAESTSYEEYTPIDLDMVKKVYLSPRGSVRSYKVDGKVIRQSASEAALALEYGTYERFDIKTKVRKNPNEFCFLPITDGETTTYTISKYSPYLRKYFDPKASDIEVVYTLDNILVIVKEDNTTKKYLFYIGMNSTGMWLGKYCIGPDMGIDPYERNLYLACVKNKYHVFTGGTSKKAFAPIVDIIHNFLFYQTSYFRYSVFTNFKNVRFTKSLLLAITCKIALGYIGQQKRDFLKSMGISEDDFDSLLANPKSKLPNTDITLDDIYRRLDITDNLKVNMMKLDELVTPIEYEDIPDA